MTHTTPEQARKIARDLDDYHSSIDRASRIALRSLADQVEVVTEARDNAVVSAKYTADLCTQALAELKVMTADCENFANQTFAAKAEAKTLIDHANAERDKCGSGAGCLHKDALIDSLTEERDVLLAYYKATRAMTTTMGHPDATAEDERRTEAAYDKATNDVQRYQRESAAIAKEAK